jgi:hypothetical protein
MGHSILLCPEHKNTSPNPTSEIVADGALLLLQPLQVAEIL